MRIVEIPGHDPDNSDIISPEAVRLALEKTDLEYLVTLPESPYEVVLQGLLESSSIRIIQVCRESEGMAICSGLTYGGKTAALLASYKGFYNSIDSLLGVALKTQSSFLFIISDKGSGAKKPTTSIEGGRHSAALLKAMNIPYYEVREEGDLHFIGEAMEQTKNDTVPIGIILRW